MLRLARHAALPRHISRVARASRPLRSSLAVVTGRRYTVGPPRRNLDFDKLFATLQPGMSEEKLARTIAALSSSTKDPSKLKKLEKTLPQYTKHFNADSLNAKVKHFLSNLTPPEESPESLIEDQRGSLAEPESQTAAGTCLSPTEELLAHLETPAVGEVIERLKEREMEQFRHIFSNIRNEAGGENLDALNHMAEFLSLRGVPIEYSYLSLYKVSLPQVEEDPLDADDISPELAGLSMKEALAQYAEMTGVSMDDVLAPNTSFNIGSSKQTGSAVSTTSKAVPAEQVYPDLMTADPLLDSRDVLELPPTKTNPYHNRVVIRNHSSIFTESLEKQGFDFGAEDNVPTKTDETEESANSRENLPFTPAELSKFYRFPLIRRRITQQTGKGKIHRQFVLMVVGNGDGLVGYGQGKDEDQPRAEAKAYAQAVRNMDWVERFEKRTIWTEMEAKLGATQLILRPRPVGFGLRCNPNLHQVLKAAGIKDVSAKVWGSRNPVNVIKAVFRMLQAGHAPLAMGDGIGGPGRKLNKGSGLRSKSDVERERGRQLISLRK